MDKIVALCKRRGFIFQSSEIYGGLNGFWDYGPLGVELKRNVKEAWWRDMVTSHDDISTPAGAPQSFQMVGIDTSLIMHPQVWKCSGHYDLFHDFMVDCRETNRRYRIDQVVVLEGSHAEFEGGAPVYFAVEQQLDSEQQAQELGRKFFEKVHKIQLKKGSVTWTGGTKPLSSLPDSSRVVAPGATKPGTLTAPREFNLMFKTTLGALGGAEDAAFLRPETAQGMFVNFKNVVDSSRVKIPFGIAQAGKSFRNEITPRNFTFRSREFEQMEMEFFCHPSESRAWYEYWRNRRYAWYQKLGIESGRLQLRDHAADELSHYSVGTADIEYAFPFLEAGSYGELEGVAHRGDFDLRSHMEGKLVKDAEGKLIVETLPDGTPKHRGSGRDLSYFDDQTRERFIPHVIEPAAGADRATLAFLCEAYHEDKQPDEKGEMQERVMLKFHPRLAPVKAAVFPLIKKQGMPELAAELYRDLKSAAIPCVYDQQAAIGRRYRRMDEIGTPYCLTIDGQTLEDKTVTLRDRDTLEQTRVPLNKVVDEILARLRG